MPNFAEFTVSARKGPIAPTVTFAVRGVITFSISAIEQMGHPEAVKLLYDADERVVGFKPASKDEKNAYPLRKTTGSDKTPKAVSASAFIRHVNVTEDGNSYRWPIFMEDGIACADLKEPGNVAYVGRGD